METVLLRILSDVLASLDDEKNYIPLLLDLSTVQPSTQYTIKFFSLALSMILAFTVQL